MTRICSCFVRTARIRKAGHIVARDVRETKERRMHAWIVASAIAGFLVTLHSAPVQATTTVSVENTAGALGCTEIPLDCTSVDSIGGGISQVVTKDDETEADAMILDFSDTAGSSVEARARAGAGVLGVYADVFAPNSDLYRVSPADSARSLAYADFIDTITVEPRAAPGLSSVNVDYILQLHGSSEVLLNGVNVPNSDLYPTLIPGIELYFYGSQQPSVTGDGAGQYTYTLDNVPVGVPVEIEGTIAVSASAPAIPGSVYGSLQAQANYFSTANFYAQVDNPDYYLVSASGHDYSMQVSEPASEWLLWAGLGGLAATMRKGRIVRRLR